MGHDTKANRAFLLWSCFPDREHWKRGREVTSSEICQRGSSSRFQISSSKQWWHLCRFTSTSCVLHIYLPPPNTLSSWRHLTWPLFWTIHFSIAPQNHSSSFFSLCTFWGTLVVFRCTFPKQEPRRRCRSSWWSPSFVAAAISSAATWVLLDAVPASNF